VKIAIAVEEVSGSGLVLEHRRSQEDRYAPSSLEALPSEIGVTGSSVVAYRHFSNDFQEGVVE
jgi:hypothetical protein